MLSICPAAGDKSSHLAKCEICVSDCSVARISVRLREYG